jgi:pyridoxal phosphate enzyme, YggS family
MNLSRIAINVAEVREKIHRATERSGRTADSVKLIAVSKYATKDDGIIDAMIAAGCCDFGESRPQILVEKALHFSSQKSNINWHLIGSLQRNKVRKILPHVALLHSLDSVALIEAIDRIVDEESLPPVSGLLEVNISGDGTKQGFQQQELVAAFDVIGTLRNIRIWGLMCMSGLHSTDGERRAEFAATRQLAEKMAGNCPDNCVLQELSMGMSDDFEMAIEEGATLVRIGSSLYKDVLF